MDHASQPSVLLVDDDEIILVALSETLSHEGYLLTACHSGPEAVRRLKKEKFHVIISDQRMAEMSGLEFFEEAKKIRPCASRILITGVLTLHTVIEAINRGEIFRFLAKPWLREDLLATVRDAVQHNRRLELGRKLQDDIMQLNERLAESVKNLKAENRRLLAEKKNWEQTREK